MPRILFIVSSARSIQLADGTLHETGYFAEEAIKPYDRFIAAGCEVVVATPDGKPPHPDSYGLEVIFHYPDEDEDFLLSVVRTFMPDVDDIRVTLHHLTELDLIAARRVHAVLLSAGMEAAAARQAVDRAARTAWTEDRNFIEVIAADPQVPARASRATLAEQAEAVRRDAQAASDRIAARLAALPGFQKPLDLSRLTDDEVVKFDAVFVPGGHGPMVDLASNPDMTRVLHLLHERDRTIAMLCHGPAALLAAGERPDGLWLFDGFKMTAFCNEEEDQTRVGKLGMPWYLESAIKNAGGVFDDAPAPWTSHVVVDRNLVTAQNPMSADAAAEAVLKRLKVTPPAGSKEAQR